MKLFSAPRFPTTVSPTLMCSFSVSSPQLSQALCVCLLGLSKPWAVLSENSQNHTISKAIREKTGHLTQFILQMGSLRQREGKRFLHMSSL